MVFFLFFLLLLKTCCCQTSFQQIHIHVYYIYILTIQVSDMQVLYLYTIHIQYSALQLFYIVMQLLNRPYFLCSSSDCDSLRLRQPEEVLSLHLWEPPGSLLGFGYFLFFGAFCVFKSLAGENFSQRRKKCISVFPSPAEQLPQTYSYLSSHVCLHLPVSTALFPI